MALDRIKKEMIEAPLDKFSDVGGSLYWDGKPVGGGGDATFIVKPTITVPTQGQTEFADTIESSTYTTTESFYGEHDFSQWQAATDSTFTEIVDENLNATVDLESWTPAISELNGVELFVRVRYASDSHFSEWSNVVSFTTPAIYVETPTLTVEGEPFEVPQTPLLEGSAFSLFSTQGETDTHELSDWEIRLSSNDSLIWSSIGDTENLTSITVDEGFLDENTSYKFRLRYKGTVYGYSDWSEVIATTEGEFAGDKGVYVGKIATPFMFGYTHDGNTLNYISPPSVIGGGNTVAIGCSYDGTYIIRMGYNAFPFVYKRTGTDVVNIGTLSGVAGDGVSGSVSFTADSQYVAIVGSTCSVFKREGDVFNLLPALPNLAAVGSSCRCSFTANGEYLAITTPNAGIQLYRRDGDEFTKLSNISSGLQYGVALSQDGEYLACTGSGSIVEVFKRVVDGEYSPLTTLTVVGGARGIYFTENFLVVSTSTTSRSLFVFKRTGDSFDLLPTPTQTGDSSDCSASKDELHFYVGLNASPWFRVYVRNTIDDSITLLGNPTPAPDGAARSVDVFPK